MTIYLNFNHIRVVAIQLGLTISFTIILSKTNYFVIRYKVFFHHYTLLSADYPKSTLNQNKIGRGLHFCNTQSFLPWNKIGLNQNVYLCIPFHTGRCQSQVHRRHSSHSHTETHSCYRSNLQDRLEIHKSLIVHLYLNIYKTS